MEIPTDVAIPDGAANRQAFGRVRLLSLLVLVVLLAVCLTVSWITRDAMTHLPFLGGRGTAHSLMDKQKTLVDLRPWQTAQALAPLAVAAEEAEYAREAERLADHEVVQAFASALRLANIEAQHRVLTGLALSLSQRVAQLQQLVKQDQAQVDSLTPVSGPTASSTKSAASAANRNNAFEIAKAQLELDSDQLADAQQDLERAAGDDRTRIQSELTAHQATMAKRATELEADRAVAIVSAAQHATLAHRLTSWYSQRERYDLIQQALDQAQADIASLTAEHSALEVKANAAVAAAGSGTPDQAAKLADMRDGSAERQVLSLYDDRIETQEQLAGVYGKWSAQVLLQHRILLHLIMQSLMLILAIFIATLLCDALMKRLLAHPVIDRRQMHTLRTLAQLGAQVLGAALILLVIFGPPQQLTTVLGLTTAGLTIALQDFILAFFGWFVLMGKGGIRVGDWVEINGVGGEVTEIGLMNTTLLETGDLKKRGHPTGRQISFLNSFAIRGQYFNFSTTGQWMWDEISVTLPPAIHSDTATERIHQVVVEETAESAGVAEHEWIRGKRDDGLGRFSAAPVVNLRPSVAGINLRVRYVTRASERFDVRNRLYRAVVDLLQQEKALDQSQQADQSHPAPGDGI
ncbi:MAG TPA: mechanosensitive ion channel domain-containing protein [Terracidiphilus sp.]|jgi:small-conductance mechanosensitive channel